MGKISTYYKKKQMAEQLAQELAEMEQDQELKKELDFKNKLRSLMEDYSKSARDMVEILAAIDPSIRNKVNQDAGGADGRKKRPLKTYRNPHTGEVVQTRGGNHKTLNAWRKQYGRDEVAGWQES